MGGKEAHIDEEDESLSHIRRRSVITCYKNAKSEKNHLNVIHQLKGEFFS